jgi:hypothetical protein
VTCITSNNISLFQCCLQVKPRQKHVLKIIGYIVQQLIRVRLSHKYVSISYLKKFKYNLILPSLTRSETLSPSTDTIFSFDSIYTKLASGIFPFTLSSTCLQALTYPAFLFSQISVDSESSMQTEQKQESFRLSNANPF